MRNCDFWNKGEAEGKWKEYHAELESQMTTLKEKGANVNPVPLIGWLYKSADTALQLKVGMVVQAKVNDQLQYAVITKITEGGYRDVGQIANFNRVHFRTASGFETWARLPEEHHVYPANMPADEMKNDDIKFADIPVEFLKLAGFACDPDGIKSKCPFKDEYKEPVPPCMKEDAE